MPQTVQIIVAGFHRSGTSMVMQALARAGVCVGRELIGADPSNADGHFEDIETVRLHDKWLEDNGSDWCRSGTLPNVDDDQAQECIQNIQSRFAALVEDQARDQAHAVWGIKDPRAALFLTAWFKHLDNPHGVFVYRHFASCLQSLQRRQANELLLNPNTNDTDIRFWSHPEAALASWLLHNKAIIALIEQHPDRCVLVSQEAQIAGTALTPIVNAHFGLSLDGSIHSGVDSSKTHRDRTVDLPSDALRAELLSTWNTLQSLSVAPATKEPVLNWHPDSAAIDMQSRMHNLTALWDKLGVPHAA
jgi:hypothetical protein